MLTDKQKAEREQALGSSDAPIVCGVSPYKSPLELYYQLHGELPRYTDEETQAQRIGAKIEPLIAELAAEELGLKIRRAATKRHAVHRWMVANLDFEIVNNPRGPGVLEIKNRSGMKPFDVLPDDIQLQVAQQLAVTNRDWGQVAVLFGFGALRTYEVVRDRELEQYLIEIELQFLLRVQRSEPPTEEWSSGNIGILKKLYPQSTGKTVVLPPDHIVNIEGFLATKKEIAALEEKKAIYEGLLKSSIGDAELAELPGWGTISWKNNKPGKSFDEKRFAVEHPDLYAIYQRDTIGARVFRPKPGKELVKA